MMKRKRVSYTADFKLNAVEKANEVGNREAARFFNVDESNIRLWRRNKTNFENCDRRKRADRRGKPHWPELEAEINKWILKERDNGKAVSTSPKGTQWSHPGMAIHVAAQIAALKDIPVEKVLQAARKNTKFVYNV
ncbi:uncharacterized protein TNCV_148641 [Trichonephila clavipes]|nr:uncharacterized protein TNCV_148641 [Trichonephila clavipes]